MFKRPRRLLALIQKEMVQALRDRRTLAIVLITPLLELFLFAYAVDLTVDHIPTAVADMSRDTASRNLINALVVSGYFDVNMYLEDEGQVVQAIDKGLVRAAVVIPPNFAAQVERGDAQALVLFDGSDSFTVQTGYSAAMAIAQTQAMALLVQQTSRLGALGVPIAGAAAPRSEGMLPIDTSSRVLYNPTMDDLVFIMPALAALILLVSAVNLTAMAVARERELGTIEQLLITPIRPMELMVSKMVPNIIVSAIGLLSVVIAGVFLLGVPFQGDPWLFAWLSLLFIVSGLGLGLLISTVSQTQHQAQQITMFLFMLSMLLTGFLYPLAAMPPVIQAVGSLLPLTYVIRITRGIFTKGVGMSFLWTDVLVLAIYTTVVTVLASVTFRKRLD